MPAIQKLRLFDYQQAISFYYDIINKTTNEKGVISEIQKINMENIKFK